MSRRPAYAVVLPVLTVVMGQKGAELYVSAQIAIL
jgi:hypothetical protein